MKKFVIWHLGQWSNNYGSMSIQSAFRNNLRQRTSDYLEFVYLDIDSVIFSKDLVNKMNSEADLLLIGSGALITSRPNNITGWQLNLQDGALENVKIPIAVYGIDSEILNGESIDSSKLEVSLKKIKEKSKFFSFRTPDTAKVFDHITEDGLVSPDISMFAAQSSITNTCFNTDKLKIGLNWPTDRWEERFGFYPKGKDYLEAVLRVLKSITETYNAKIFVIEHSQKSNANLAGKNVLRDLASSIFEDENFVFVFDSAPEFWPPQEIYTDFFGEIYNKMDFVLSGRAISSMESFGRGTPFLALGPNTKLKNIVSYIVGPGNYVDLRKANIKSLERVILNKIKSSDSIKEHLINQKAIFEAIKNAHLDSILDLL